MGQVDCPPPFAIVEAAPLEDVFIRGVHDVEVLGHNARIICYAEQQSIVGGETERRIKLQVVMEIDHIPEAIGVVMRAIWSKVAATVWASVWAMVSKGNKSLHH